MAFVPAAFLIVMFGLFSIGTVEALRSGVIDTKSGRFGAVKRSEKPVGFWALIAGWMVLNLGAAYSIVNWALSK